MQSFLTLIEQIEKELPSSERRIADYVLQNPSAPLFMTMTELAAAAGSSPAIVVRLCKRLNVDGYSDFKIRLSREVFSNEGKEEEPEQVMDNFYDSGLGTRELIVQYIKFTSKNLANLESILDPKTVDAAADLIYRSKTVLLLGTGSAEVILNDLQYKLARLGKNVIYTKDVNLQSRCTKHHRELSCTADFKKFIHCRGIGKIDHHIRRHITVSHVFKYRIVIRDLGISIYPGYDLDLRIILYK